MPTAKTGIWKEYLGSNLLQYSLDSVVYARSMYGVPYNVLSTGQVVFNYSQQSGKRRSRRSKIIKNVVSCCPTYMVLQFLDTTPISHNVTKNREYICLLKQDVSCASSVFLFVLHIFCIQSKYMLPLRLPRVPNSYVHSRAVYMAQLLTHSR